MTSLNPNAVTSDIIQQYLDENKQLILTILENQNAGKLSECAENQARLQHNLMYLAAIADSQPQPPILHPQQYQGSGAVQTGGRYPAHQQVHPMTPQSLMAARSSLLYTQQPLTLLQQQQRQQATLHGQLGFTPGGTTSGLHMLPPDQGGSSSGPPAVGFPDFRGEGLPSAVRGLPGSGIKAEFGSSDGRTDGSQPLYMKTGPDEEGN